MNSKRLHLFVYLVFPLVFLAMYCYLMKPEVLGDIETIWRTAGIVVGFMSAGILYYWCHQNFWIIALLGIVTTFSSIDLLSSKYMFNHTFYLIIFIAVWLAVITAIHLTVIKRKPCFKGEKLPLLNIVSGIVLISCVIYGCIILIEKFGNINFGVSNRYFSYFFTLYCFLSYCYLILDVSKRMSSSESKIQVKDIKLIVLCFIVILSTPIYFIWGEVFEFLFFTSNKIVLQAIALLLPLLLGWYVCKENNIQHNKENTAK